MIAIAKTASLNASVRRTPRLPSASGSSGILRRVPAHQPPGRLR
ncbi:MAG TPA: hypothetical protein VH306_03515 [Gaiellaceae bacterium]